MDIGVSYPSSQPLDCLDVDPVTFPSGYDLEVGSGTATRAEERRSLRTGHLGGLGNGVLFLL